MFKNYSTIIFLVFWVNIPLLAQNTSYSGIVLYAGLSAQVNGPIVGPGDQLAAESGSSFRSSNGIGIPIGVRLQKKKYFLGLSLTNRYARTVDNRTSLTKDDVYKIVQDAHIYVGRNISSRYQLLNNTSFSFGVSVYSLGQDYEGGRIFKQEPNPAGGTIFVEVTPSSIQFPSITFNYSKLLFSMLEVGVGVSMYDSSWRPDIFGGKLVSLFSFSATYNIKFSND